MQHISKFLFSTSDREQELFGNQLLGQFPQNLSFSSSMYSRHFVIHHLGSSADQWATLKHGIWKPESGIHKSKKTSSSNMEKLHCIVFACKKNQEANKKNGFKLHLFWNISPPVEIGANVISSEGYGYEDPN